MSATANVMKRNRQSGQTLIIALLILGVLLILGFVFLGLISRNITSTGRAQQRSVANDLAEAGIRFVHGQLLTNPQAADWRPQETLPIGYDPIANPGYPHFAANVPRDPDYQYLRPAPRAGDPGFPNDKGGPDGLGPYSRVEFDAGRAVVRSLYGPSDANVFSNNPAGALRLPGRAKNYIIIESIGKPGKVNANDPTTAGDVRGEREKIQSRKLIAFASIGITEQAFFVTNKFRVSRPAEFGAPNETGVAYDDRVGGPSPVPAVQIPTQIGDQQLLPNLTGGTSLGPVPYGGSVYINADLVVHGRVTAYLNRYLGDSWDVAGKVIGADDTNAQLQIAAADVNGAGNWTFGAFTLTNVSGTSLDSNSQTFSTATGLVRDGLVAQDRDGYNRSLRRKEPPSFLVEDPVTHESVYRQMTRDSGAVGPAGNTGSFGHGQGVYTNNTSDRQNRNDEQGREVAETSESLVFDWLNPNNGQAGTGWQGVYYIPRGAYLQLVPDGFIILRDSRAPVGERTWRNPDGSDTSNSVNRYKIVRTGNGLFIANSYTPFGAGVTLNTATPAQIEASGQPFTGVVYFEGNVRVRGTIPTDVQLTVVSGATIYIEGSITKGIVRTQAAFDQTGPVGQRITMTSRSMLMLAAKDYVAVNTSQFFGPAPTQVIEEVNDLPSASEHNPIRMRRNATPGYPSSYNLRAEFLLDPNSGNPANPSMWKPYSAAYEEFGTANFINPGLLITHTMDDGPAANSFISMDINYGVGNWGYLFDLNRTPAITPINVFDPFQKNNASDYNPYATPGFTEPGYGAAQQNRGLIYGIGAENWQRYSKFETTFFPLAQSNGAAGAYGTWPTIPVPAEHGTYTLLAQETNDLTLRFNDIGANPSNDYLIARAAIMPNDIRIEASVFAEDGSFFVIPSPWFNPNANDRRDIYLTRVAAVGAAQAQLERLENYGSAPVTPFYGEPVDVKVRFVGAISQNMPAPMSQQGEWLKKWGWIPRTIGDVRDTGTGNNRLIPEQHVPDGYDLSTDLYVPNLVITYDPVLGSGRAWNPANTSPFSPANPAIRTDAQGRMLPPMPRLPVSPTLAYFGEVN